MKFIRRPDLTPQTRIHIVMLAWLHQGVYGKMTPSAKAYRMSRTGLSQLLVAATIQRDVLLRDDQPPGHKPSSPFDHLALFLRLEGKGSMASIAAIVQPLGYQPNSVGHLSAGLQQYGQALSSTVSMPSHTLGCSLREAIFAIPAPIVVTSAPHSLAQSGFLLFAM